MYSLEYMQEESMYFFRWQNLRPLFNEQEDLTPDPVELPVPLSEAVAYDRAYVESHPELYTNDKCIFHYDRTPFPSEWDEDAPSDSFVRVFVINPWTTVRVLHTSNGTRLQAPQMNSWACAA
jgi:hypothetical protein